jgi:hypothetical protein
MRAVIKVCYADKEFRQDQIAIIKRIALVLVEHDLSVVIDFKEKKVKNLNIKLRVV